MSDTKNERPDDDYIDNPPSIAETLVSGINELAEPRDDDELPRADEEEDEQ